jgi:hypothetical protein
MEANSYEAASEPIRFRAGKKRKAYRQRVQEDDDAVAETVQSPHTASTAESNYRLARINTPDKEEDGEGSVAAALRLRNARRSRLGGVAFRNSNRLEDDTDTERALVPHNADETSNNESVIKRVTDRFTHQTGKVADLNDRHMMDYIESRLSNRVARDSSQPTSSASASDPARQSSTTATKHEAGRAVMQGQLMEIDLGDQAQDSSAARNGHAGQGEGDERRAKKPRLRRDGKPWRPRKRRDSDAVKRDQLVDEILREARRMYSESLLFQDIC